MGALVSIEEMWSFGTFHIDQKTETTRNREHPRVYLWNTQRSMTSFTFEDGEVDALCAIDLGDLKDLLEGKEVAGIFYDGRVSTVITVRRDQLVPLGDEYWEKWCEKLDKVLRERRGDQY